MTAIRTVHLTSSNIIDAFAARLPEGIVRAQLEDMASMPYKSLFVYSGRIEMRGDRIIGNTNGFIDGQKKIGTRVTHRTITVHSREVICQDVTDFEHCVEEKSETRTQAKATVEDLLYACGCFGEIPPYLLRQISALRETLRL